MLSKYVWLITMEKISFIRSCDMEVIKATDCIIKVHITSGNIKWRSFALRFRASNQKAHDNLRFPLRRAYHLLYVFTLCKSQGDLHLSFLHFILWQAHCVGKILIYIYIYPIGCKLAWTIIVDITLEVKGWEAKP